MGSVIHSLLYCIKIYLRLAYVNITDLVSQDVEQVSVQKKNHTTGDRNTTSLNENIGVAS